MIVFVKRWVEALETREATGALAHGRAAGAVRGRAGRSPPRSVALGHRRGSAILRVPGLGLAERLSPRRVLACRRPGVDRGVPGAPLYRRLLLARLADR